MAKDVNVIDFVTFDKHYILDSCILEVIPH